jgi:hypothetical protein
MYEDVDTWISLVVAHLRGADRVAPADLGVDPSCLSGQSRRSAVRIPGNR